MVFEGDSEPFWFLVKQFCVTVYFCFFDWQTHCMSMSCKSSTLAQASCFQGVPRCTRPSSGRATGRSSGPSSLPPTTRASTHTMRRTSSLFRLQYRAGTAPGRSTSTAWSRLAWDEKRFGASDQNHRHRCPEACHGLSEAALCKGSDVPWVLRALQRRRSRPLSSIKQKLCIVRMCIIRMYLTLGSPKLLVSVELSHALKQFFSGR